MDTSLDEMLIVFSIGIFTECGHVCVCESVTMCLLSAIVPF